MIRSQNLTTLVLLALLLILSLGCADNPTEPELTEEDVARIVAEELAKRAEDAEEVPLTPPRDCPNRFRGYRTCRFDKRLDKRFERII